MITDEIDYTLTRKDLTIFGAYEGPYIQGNPSFRLFVRAAHLGYEVVADSVSNHRILSRRRFMRLFREIAKPVGWAEPGGLLHTGVLS